MKNAHILKCIILEVLKHSCDHHRYKNMEVSWGAWVAQ